MRWRKKKHLSFMVLRPQHGLEKPHQVTACVQFGPFPSSAELRCASQLAWTVVSVSRSLEPTPAVAPTRLRGWPTWNTIQDSTGPLTLQTLMDKMCLCVASVAKTKPAFNNANKTQILNIYMFMITCGTPTIRNNLIKKLYCGMRS